MSDKKLDPFSSPLHAVVNPTTRPTLQGVKPLSTPTDDDAPLGDEQIRSLYQSAPLTEEMLATDENIAALRDEFLRVINEEQVRVVADRVRKVEAGTVTPYADRLVSNEDQAELEAEIARSEDTLQDG